MKIQGILHSYVQTQGRSHHLNCGPVFTNKYFFTNFSEGTKSSSYTVLMATALVYNHFLVIHS